jgi:hypothetical protein
MKPLSAFSYQLSALSESANEIEAIAQASAVKKLKADS